MDDINTSFLLDDKSHVVEIGEGISQMRKDVRNKRLFEIRGVDTNGNQSIQI